MKYDDDFLSDKDFREMLDGTWSRRSVIETCIVNGAKTPDTIRAVAKSIGEEEYGDDPLVLQVLNNYWAEEEQGGGSPI